MIGGNIGCQYHYHNRHHYRAISFTLYYRRNEKTEVKIFKINCLESIKFTWWINLNSCYVESYYECRMFMVCFRCGIITMQMVGRCSCSTPMWVTTLVYGRDWREWHSCISSVFNCWQVYACLYAYKNSLICIPYLNTSTL